jgi:hypothetical protein
MKANLIRAATALVLLAAAASGHAKYKCDAPPSRIDERACEEARKGPDHLRRFIQRMASITTYLWFADYVDRDDRRPTSQ